MLANMNNATEEELIEIDRLRMIGWAATWLLVIGWDRAELHMIDWFLTGNKTGLPVSDS